MVFPEDLKWRHDYLTSTGYFHDNHSAVSNPRFRSWGTEELLIRCIRKNLPWIRTIYIILARQSQVQPWMKSLSVVSGSCVPSVASVQRPSAPADTPSVRIVYHSDIMPKEVLPTFNSRAIEMYLHRIPDLAPYFLYGNDDMFPIAPMEVSDFFRESSVPSVSPTDDGSVPAGFASGILPCLHYTHKTFNPSNAFHIACMNGLNFVAADFGRQFTDYWLRVGHNVVPMVRSTCEMFWQRWPKEMQASVTRFRLPQNYNQYIYSWWQILSGQYVEHRAPRCYVSVDDGVEKIREAIRTADGLLCINDNSSVNDITNLAAVVRSEIQKRL